jgi:hypothetical protein
MKTRTDLYREAMRQEWDKNWEYSLLNMPYEVFLQEELVIAVHNVGRELRVILEALTEKGQS